MSIIASATMFSRTDASVGYWQMQLDEEPANLLAFNKLLDRFRFYWLPFGHILYQ